MTKKEFRSLESEGWSITVRLAPEYPVQATIVDPAGVEVAWASDYNEKDARRRVVEEFTREA